MTVHAFTLRFVKLASPPGRCWCHRTRSWSEEWRVRTGLRRRRRGRLAAAGRGPRPSAPAEWRRPAWPDNWHPRCRWAHGKGGAPGR